MDRAQEAMSRAQQAYTFRVSEKGKPILIDSNGYNKQDYLDLIISLCDFCIIFCSFDVVFSVI